MSGIACKGMDERPRARIYARDGSLKFIQYQSAVNTNRVTIALSNRKSVVQTRRYRLHCIAMSES